MAVGGPVAAVTLRDDPRVTHPAGQREPNGRRQRLTSRPERRALAAIKKARAKKAGLSAAELRDIAERAAREASDSHLTAARPATFATTADDRVRLKLRDQLIKTTGKALRDLPTLPGVQSLSIATRYIEGGREKFIAFVQLAALNRNDHALKWFYVYADLTPTERAVVSFDDVCAASGVTPAELMGAVTTHAMQVGVDVGNLVAALTHPQVVAAGSRAAMHPDGIEDRRMLFQHHGFVPTPKNATINVHASANAQAAAAVKASNPELESFGDSLRAVQQVASVPRGELGPATPAETFEYDDLSEGELVPAGAGGDDEVDVE